MLSLGPRLPLSGCGCRPPASLSVAGDGPVRSQLALLWYLLSPLFCEQTWRCLRLELFVGMFSLSPLLFFPLSLAIPQFGLLSPISSLRMSSGLSGPVLTLSNAAYASLFHPHLLVVYASTENCSYVHNLCVLFIFSSWLCRPLKFQNSPQTCW